MQLSKKNIRSWQDLIAYLPQESFLFDGSIKENITFCSDDDCIDKIKLDEAIKKAKLRSFIDELPMGLNSKTGDKGSKISGGQKQRISLARAFYFDKQILVFDEATSALDNITEKKIQTSISNLMKDRTSLIIAHRLSSIENSDIIYVLDKGKIINFGKHEELLNKCKLYSKLHLQEELNKDG